MTDLGRRVPTDWQHVDRYPLRALAPAARPVGVPVVIGVNWYAEFDRPVKGSDGRWRVATDGRLTRVRGGHCVCLLPAGVTDLIAWWDHYDQLGEGACVGEGWSRCMSLLNRVRYDPFWLYRTTQLRDEWEDTPPSEGTSVRAGGETLRIDGHRITRRGKTGPVDPAQGISAYRWATNIQDVLDTLGRTAEDEVPILNSWGRGYPHIVRMPAAVLDRLRIEDGEFAIPTDR